MSATEVVAKSLAEHAAVGFAKCRCGWTYEVPIGTTWRREHEQHQAEAIAALPGWAVVQLPDPETVEEYGYMEWEDINVVCQRGSGRVRIHIYDHRFQADDARVLAAQILAGAAAAENDQ